MFIIVAVRKKDGGKGREAGTRFILSSNSAIEVYDTPDDALTAFIDTYGENNPHLACSVHLLKTEIVAGTM